MGHTKPKRGKRAGLCNDPLSCQDEWRATVRYRRGVGILSERRLRHFAACAAAVRLVTQPSPNKTIPAAQRREIGGRLRQMYDDIVAEGVPERFAEILRRLDDADEGSKDGPIADRAS